MAEKRKFTRVSIKSVAEIIFPNDEFSQAYVGGISRGGLEMYTQIEMTSGQVHAVRLHFLFQGKERTETVEGKVKWSASFKNAFISGMEFTTVLNAADHINLLLFIEQAEAFYK
jgi:hypothetical protein